MKGLRVVAQLKELLDIATREVSFALLRSEVLQIHSGAGECLP